MNRIYTRPPIVCCFCLLAAFQASCLSSYDHGGFFVHAWPGTCQEVRDKVIEKCKTDACFSDGVDSLAIKAGESGDPQCVECLLDVYRAIDGPLGERILMHEAPVEGQAQPMERLRTCVQWALVALSNEEWRPLFYDPFPNPPASAAWEALKEIRPDIETVEDGNRLADALRSRGLTGYRQPTAAPPAGSAAGPEAE